MRAGTENIASIIAMAEALKKNCNNMQQTEEKLSQIEEIFIQKLQNSKIQFIRNGAEKHLPGSISISIKLEK